jgi:Mn-dependent DtxR family transcriptional regulator
LDHNSEKDRLAETIFDVLKNDKPATVKELANLVKQRQPTPEQQILESIMKLQDEGKIRFTAQPKPQPTSLADYLQTSATWY